MRSLRRASLLAGVLTMAIAANAFAHECYNASTSTQGALSKAAHSQTWELAVNVEELISTGSSGFISGAPVLDECQQEAFLASWSQTGLPLVFTVGIGQAAGQGGTIAERNPNMELGLGGDNHGIEHFSVTEGTIDAALNDAYTAAFSASCS